MQTESSSGPPVAPKTPEDKPKKRTNVAADPIISGDGALGAGTGTDCAVDETLTAAKSIFQVGWEASARLIWNALLTFVSLNVRTS